MAIKGIRYYGVEGHVNAESPVIKIKANVAISCEKGNVYQSNSAGKLIAWVGGGTKIIGLCEYDQKVAAGEEVELRLAVPTIWYKVDTYSSAVNVGVTLDIHGDGDKLTGTSNKDVRVMYAAAANKPVIFRIQSRALHLAGDA